MTIKESDWKIFRNLREFALERYCHRVLGDVRVTVDEQDKTYHQRYLNLFELLRQKDKELAFAFDAPRRSQAFIQLMTIITEDLLTDAEVRQFSQETRDRIELFRQKFCVESD
jgi:hypothetical protein